MDTGQREQPLFSETQRFVQWWLIVIIVMITALAWWAAIEQLMLGRPWGDNPMPDAVLIVFFIIFGVGLPWLFLAMRLETYVYTDYIRVRLFPLHVAFRVIAFKEIKECGARKYNPLMEYGGWGIRYGPQGQAYNVKGNWGIQFELLNGNRLLIGTQKPDEFAAALQQAGKK